MGLTRTPLKEKIKKIQHKQVLNADDQYASVLQIKECTTMTALNSHDANILIRIGYILYKLIGKLALYCVIIPCAYELYLGEKSKITDYTLNIMNTGAYLCSILTLHFFHGRGYMGRELMTNLNENFKYTSTSGISDINMEHMNKVTQKITKGFFSLLTTGVISMTLVPLLMKGRLLPIPGVYPVDITETSNYVLLYSFQAFAQLLIGTVTSSSDAFFICMVLVAAEQFKILAHDFHNCLYTALLECGVPEQTVLDFKCSHNDADLLRSSKDRGGADIGISETANREISDKSSEQLHLMEVITSERFERKLMELLINYIKHHQNLLNFCEKMEDFFWPLIFMKAATSMFYHIFITYAMLSTTETSMALTLAQYEVCAISELFIFAMAGQALINESENFQEVLYASPWYFCNQKYKSSVYMILIRCGRPCRVTVGKLVDMSVSTFVLIMKTALSYLAVLRQVTE